MAEAPSEPRGRGLLVEWVGRFGLILFGVVLTVALLELAIRVGLNFYTCDEELGWRFASGKTGLRVSRKGEFTHVVRLNELGFHDSERSLEKPANGWRVAFLGDSFVAAMQVPQEETFTSVLEGRLNAKSAGHRFEVINNGVDGYGTGQQLLLHRELTSRFQPDLVFVGVFLHNDVRDNSAELGDDLHSLAYRCGRPYFVSAPAGIEFARGPVPGSRMDGGVQRWLRTSDLYSTFFPVPTDDRALRAYFKYDVYSRVYTPPIERAFELTKRLLLELREEVRERGSELAVLIVPDRFQVSPGLARLVQEETEQSLDVDRPSRILREFLEGAGLPYVDVAPALAGRIRAGGRPYYRRDAHWNAEGHGLVAAVIDDWLHRNCASLGVPVGACAENRENAAGG